MIARLKRLEEHFTEHGMRRTCEGILVCHEHNHPHILMLQIANAFFKLPGDYLRPEDDEETGFKARLDERLAPVGRIGEGEEAGDWEVGDCLAQWWRPNFETFMYPFVPAHVTRPKECKKLYFIHLPKTSMTITTRVDIVPPMLTRPELDRSTECSKEYEAPCGATLRALRQHRPIWTSTFSNTTSSQPLQFRIC